MNALPQPREFSPISGEIMETVLIKGDLRFLTPAQRIEYHEAICRTAGLNSLTRPFAYIELNGKLTLYALKACTDQLRQIHGVSVKIISHKVDGDLYTVHVRAKDAASREDEDFGVVVLPPETRALDRANAILKAVTKAKRRVTLSICGLGFLDETEVEDIPVEAKREVSAPADQEVVDHPNGLETHDNLAGGTPADAFPSTTSAPAIKKPARKRKDPGREADPRYEAIIRADQPRRAFDHPEPDNPDAERDAWEAEQRAEEFVRLEHEIQCLPTLDALNRWVGDNHARIAKFSDGEKNGLRMAWANKKASLEPHSVSQRAMAARGQRYVRPESYPKFEPFDELPEHSAPPKDDGLDIPPCLDRRRQMNGEASYAELYAAE